MGILFLEFPTNEGPAQFNCGPKLLEEFGLVLEQRAGV